MPEPEALKRLLERRPNDSDRASFVAEHEDWMQALNALYADNLQRAEVLLSDGSSRIEIFEKLGREGRRLKFLATEALASEYAVLSKERLSIERAIEAVGRAVALGVAEHQWRLNLSNLLIEEIALHRQNYEADPSKANARLWNVIEGAVH